MGHNRQCFSFFYSERTVITDKPDNYEVAAGSSATFRCNAHADDSLPLELIWLNDGQPIDFDAQPRFRMTNDYSLLISDTTELDSGEYTCIARTPVDEARAQATLTVQGTLFSPCIGRSLYTLYKVCTRGFIFDAHCAECALVVLYRRRTPHLHRTHFIWEEGTLFSPCTLTVQSVSPRLYIRRSL